MTGGAILLAAGFSRRFGSDKRRHRLADGTPLLTSSLRRYRQAFPRIVVVLRPEDADLARELHEMVLSQPGNPVHIVTCAEAHLGMGRSLARGAQAAEGWTYVFVALADMPWVRPDTLRRLIETMAAGDEWTVVQPVHHGRPGHPVGFGAGYLPRLRELTGDEGARAVVQDAPEHRVAVAVDDPGVLQDLDQPPPD